jgi:hypothetical protein
VIANVNIDVPDVASDLGVEFHFLVRQELARNGQCVGKGRAPNLYDCGAWGRIG